MNEDDVRRIGNDIAVAGPIPPGRRELLVGYLLPAYATELRVSIDRFVEEFAVMLEDSAASVVGDDLTFIGVRELEDGLLRQFGADRVEPGTTLIVRLPRSPS